jgi:hypothetical protein
MADEDSGEGKRQMGVNMTHRFLKRLNESRQTMKTLITAVLILLMLGMAQAELRQSKERNHNYILRRQEAGLVTSVPYHPPDLRQARDRCLSKWTDVRRRSRGGRETTLR